MGNGGGDLTRTRDSLAGFIPGKPFFVGVDSDGCVLDSMEAKQRRCFHPVTLSLWHLGPVAEAARDVLAFVNLHSRWRGQHRFIAQALSFDLLRRHPDVRDAGVHVPELTALKRLIASGQSLSNQTLEQAVRDTGDPELERCLLWSRAVNDAIERTIRHVPPFPFARETLAIIRLSADVVCISQTPAEALFREWESNNLVEFADAIAGQELGTKRDQLAMATQGRYASDRVLMIGDAVGDLDAARAAGALFYPINPGQETSSWKALQNEAFDRFLSGRFAGAYQKRLVETFMQLLPETPPWEARGRSVV